MNTFDHRHKQVEQLKEESLAILGDTNVARRLGNGVTSLLEQAVEYSVAAVPDADGFLEFSRDSPEIIPVAISRSIGGRALLHANDSLMTPGQIRHFGDQYSFAVAEHISNLFNESIATSRQHLPLSIAGSSNHDSFGAMSSNSQVLTNSATGKEHLVFGRPIVEMNARYWSNSDVLSPLVFMHEIVHVLQRRQEPFAVMKKYDSEKNRVRDELEAFYAGAQMILGLKESGKEQKLQYIIKSHHEEGTLAIDAVRAAHQPPGEKFVVTQQLIANLRSEKLHYPVGLSK